VGPEVPPIAHGRLGMRRMTHLNGLKRQRGRRFRGSERQIRAVLSGPHPLVNGVQLVLTPPERTFGPMTLGLVGQVVMAL
jgi:hypothetical protein